MAYIFTRTGAQIEEIHNTVDNLPNIVSNENLISNSSFEIAGSVNNPPDATPRSYNAGDELFQGVFAATALTGVTYIDGKVNGSGQLYTDIYKTEKQKLSTANHVASIADSNGSPIEAGSSLVDSADYWRVTFDMNNTFSVKLEQGSVATGHGTTTSLQSHVSIQTSTGTAEEAVAIVIGDTTCQARVIGEGCVLIGGYKEENKNRLPGTTELRSIIAGYDCEITERGVSDDGGLACVIVGSHHSEIQGDATHTIVQGGSYLIVTDGDYNGLIGGTLNELRNSNARPTHSGIVFGRESIADNANVFIAGSLRSTASGEFSSIISGQDSLAEGNFDSVTGSKNESRKGTLGGGQKNTISGGRFNIIDSNTNPVGNVISGGENNATYGVYNTICGGTNNSCGSLLGNVTYSGILSGLDNKINDDVELSAILGGRENEVSANYSSILFGRGNKTSAQYSASQGLDADSKLAGGHTIANGAFSLAGDAQSTFLVKKVVTTDATPAGTGAMVLADNTTWAFHCLISARRTDGNENAAYEVKGCIKRDSGEASVALVGTPIVTVIAEDSSAWDVLVRADTSQGSLNVDVSGDVSKNIRWVCRVTLTEVSG